MGAKKGQNQGVCVPKGCLAIKVGQTKEEEQRIVLPVVYFNHPLFRTLLKEAEEEYGFDQKGTITIPCHFQDFLYVQDLIHQEMSFHGGHHHGLNNHGHHGHHNPIVGCFKA